MLAEKLQEAAGNGTASTLYVDDVFSTWLYTGTGSTQTITNGIDLSGQGGMTWIKSRSAATDHKLTDTARGATKALISDTTGAQTTDANGLTAFSSTGFSIGTDSVYNTNAATYASWAFRKAAKFFDVVTYTGTGSARTIAHNLGIAPGMVIVKRTDTTGNWQVYSNGLTSAAYSIQLNLTDAQASATTVWNSTAPTSSVFSVGTDATVNASGGTYVAYLFAHDTSSTGIIQCGSFTDNSPGAMINVNLGWETQYVLVKNAGPNIGAYGEWRVFDVMRGMAESTAKVLYPDKTYAEDTDNPILTATSTGFKVSWPGGASGNTYIYMAIRRPNKPPTSGSQVYKPVARSGTGATGSSTSFGQVTDLVFTKQRGSTQTWAWTDRLRGATKELTSAATTVETTYANDLTGFDIMTGFYFGSGASGQMNTSGSTYDDHLFRRAPGFFDVVCYTGTGSATTQAHNLTVVPELIITRFRSNTGNWIVGSSAFGSFGVNDYYMTLNTTSGSGSGGGTVFPSAPTSTTFTIGSAFNSGYTCVAYLFATLAGISKVGSYTGNGGTQNIDCGFAAGARFFLVKATSTTGSWWVWDSARGIVAGNDPALQLNSTAAEITTADAVDPYSPGITVNQEATCSINASGVSYIFLAVA